MTNIDDTTAGISKAMIQRSRCDEQELFNLEKVVSLNEKPVNYGKLKLKFIPFVEKNCGQ